MAQIWLWDSQIAVREKARLKEVYADTYGFILNQLSLLVLLLSLIKSIV